jgi:hypothetical protein
LRERELPVAGHEELGLAGFSHREQVTVLGVRGDWAGGQVAAVKREVPKARGEQLGRAGAKSRSEKWPAGDIAKFLYERIRGDQRESVPLPGIE